MGRGRRQLFHSVFYRGHVGFAEVRPGSVALSAFRFHSKFTRLGETSELSDGCDML